MRPIAAGHPGLRLLTDYSGSLARLQSLDGGLRDLASRHIADLVSLLARDPDRTPDDEKPSLPAARLAAARRLMEDAADDPDLRISDVAARVGVSPRYLQRLFESEGASFGAAMKALRLDRAFSRLRDPRWDGHKILDIAYGVGFADVSHFNRAFRLRFGATPRDIRAREPAG